MFYFLTSWSVTVSVFLLLAANVQWLLAELYRNKSLLLKRLMRATFRDGKQNNTELTNSVEVDLVSEVRGHKERRGLYCSHKFKLKSLIWLCIITALYLKNINLVYY